MSSNTYIVTSAFSFTFPFEGSWESGGIGYSHDDGSTGDIPTLGSISPANTFNGENILAIGISENSGYGGNAAPSPNFCIVMPEGLPQDLFSNVTVQLSGACTSIFTFDTANVTLFSQGPVDGPFCTNWVWSVGDTTSMFANGVTTTVTFSVAGPAMTLDATPVSDSEIDLTWTDTVNTANNYNVSRDGTVIAHLANTVFSFNDTGLDPSTTYSYEIAGVT
jgi:hypothetical protein